MIKAKVNSVHVLRGAAAFLVVIAHSMEHGHLGGPLTVFVGRFSVEVFFVISGFVITLTAGMGTFNPGTFAKHRFLRVAPLYWLTTIIVALLALLTPHALKSTPFELEYFVKSMLFIPMPIPGTIDWRPIFKLGWTLNYEVFFYIVVLMLFWCRTGLQRSYFLLGIMGILAIASFFVEVRSNLLSYYANLNMLPFMAGVILAELHRNGRLPRYNALLLLALCAGAVISTAIATTYDHEDLRNPAGHFFLTGGAVLVMLSALVAEKRISFESRPFLWFGDISYSIYLLHMFVIGAGWALIHKLGVVPGLNLPFIAIWLGMIGGSLIVGTLSFNIFEKPLVRLGRSRKPELKQSLA